VDTKTGSFVVEYDFRPQEITSVALQSQIKLENQRKASKLKETKL